MKTLICLHIEEIYFNMIIFTISGHKEEFM